MWRLLLVGVTVAMVVGCGPSKRRLRNGDDTDDKTQDAVGPGDKRGGDKPVADKPNPDLGTKRPGGGVVTAVNRAVNLNEMQNIQKFIQIAELDFNRMPTAQEVAQSLQRSAPKTYELIQSGVIVITGTRNREGIWAYTKDPQSVAGEHLVVTGSSCGRMTADELRRLLQEQ